MAKKRRVKGGSDSGRSPRGREQSGGRSTPSGKGPDLDRRSIRERFSRTFVPPELFDAKRRKAWGLGQKETDRGPYIIELNLQHVEGVEGAQVALENVHKKAVVHNTTWPIQRISKTYVRCEMTPREWQRLLGLDTETAETAARDAAEKAAGDAAPQIGRPIQVGSSMRYRAIYKLWPDFPVETQIFRSMPTIKADAARRAYEAAGADIVWAVVDSGIESSHPHFNSDDQHTLDAPEVANLHRCFATLTQGFAATPAPLLDPDDEKNKSQRPALLEQHRTAALRDDYGHGTHVAGIIAGAAPSKDAKVCALERIDRINANGESERGAYDAVRGVQPERMHGVAPRCRLVSLRVLDEEGKGRSSNVIRALDYIREKLNDNPKLLRVHGVNLSIGYEFEAEMFACGQSPLCAEVNRLVQSGVVVVAAAGNTGYGMVRALQRQTKVGLTNTINDPGNAELAITVGATHRDSPHTFGVSYFSSKGPTGDGRQKPDLVAPGERIVSCAAGTRKASAVASAGQLAEGAQAYYIEDSGTSMAAPHVSGAIAAFLSIRREFIGKPLDVKRIFCSTATPLGRERYFEGHGLLDLIRAIQSV
jgi:subtilisin family serine protease